MTQTAYFKYYCMGIYIIHIQYIAVIYNNILNTYKKTWWDITLESASAWQHVTEDSSVRGKFSLQGFSWTHVLQGWSNSFNKSILKHGIIFKIAHIFYPKKMFRVN